MNIADRIEASGRTWKLYGESMPAPGYASDNAGLYATRHVPYLYYRDILGNAARRKRHVVPYTRLADDMRSAATTPDYAFIVPNTVDDMHDCVDRRRRRLALAQRAGDPAVRRPSRRARHCS